VLRIVKKRWKFGYLVAGFALLSGIDRLIVAIGVPDLLGEVLSSVIPLAFIFGGARCFRGRREPVAPLRAWWRTTSRPTAGFVLAALFFLLVAGNVLTSIIRPITITITSASISGSVIFVVLTAAYLNSAIRLVSHPPLLLPESDPVQKWKPLKL
jgi:hypothetical protein